MKITKIVDNIVCLSNIICIFVEKLRKQIKYLGYDTRFLGKKLPFHSR